MTDLTLIHDRFSEEGLIVATERHAGFVHFICDAIEAAIAKGNNDEAGIGYGPITRVELTEIMANVMGDVLGTRGVTQNALIETLLTSEFVIWEAPVAERAPNGDQSPRLVED